MFSNWIDAVNSPNPNVVNYKQLENLTDLKGYPILLSNSMDAVISLNPNGR